MAKLTIEEIIAKREECVERLKTKTCLIHSKFLDGDIEFHSLTREDLADTRDILKSDAKKGVSYFIYMSADDLRDPKLLKAFNCDKKENYKIVDRLFTEPERARIITILEELNGLNSVNPDEIYRVEVEEIKN
jgi:hypothetical protein